MEGAAAGSRAASGGGGRCASCGCVAGQALGGEPQGVLAPRDPGLVHDSDPEAEYTAASDLIALQGNATLHRANFVS